MIKQPNRQQGVTSSVSPFYLQALTTTQQQKLMSGFLQCTMVPPPPFMRGLILMLSAEAPLECHKPSVAGHDVLELGLLLP